ncbi:dsRNA-binding domain-like protein [Fragilariopsis cylindrus CCMP1102]|uniref:DsRNA-binding domain-like protein n=1 Tax=Fragilariopsis cylindrus CCMP1102 TaxID=635003 RepID=A0A1E7FI02_9STRA|nr:dsRNA-binding domain-like protein [Fragilariopsis cylindrus CCMP1102]|eukprot:OEU17802.1 dsRNA-binding domain-like protein [Fragilariopsis cylindrus CCMP1102]
MSSSYNFSKSEQHQQQQLQHHHGQQQQSTSSLLPSSVPSSSNTLIGPTLDATTTTNNTNISVAVDENVVVRDYVPPGIIRSPLPNNNKGKNNNSNVDGSDPHHHNNLAAKQVQWVYNPADGSILTDHNNMPVSVDRLLATKPLRHELSSRPGPGNKKLTYLSGEGVSRTLNDVFGFDGWDLDIQNVSREACTKDAKTSKHSVVYTARVRLTHKASGAYKEDCGAGDSTDRNFGTAISHALKASITDAMKRAARHFGKASCNTVHVLNCILTLVVVVVVVVVVVLSVISQHLCYMIFYFHRGQTGEFIISREF